MRAILAFAPLLGRLKGPIALTLLLSLITLLAGIGLLGLSGWFLTAAALSTLGSAFNIFAPSAGVRGLSFIRILSRYGEKLSGHDMTLRLLSDLRAWLFARLFPLVPLARRFGRGDLVSRLLADVEALDTVFLVALGPISTAVLAGGAMTLVLVLALPGAALTYALLFFAAVLLVPIGLVLASRAAGAEAVAANAMLRQAVLDGIDGHQDLVLFDATDAAAGAAAVASGRLSRARRGLGLRAALASALVQLLAGGALIGTLLAGLAALEQGTLDGPLLAGLLLAVIASFEASAMLVRSATRLAGEPGGAAHQHGGGFETGDHRQQQAGEQRAVERALLECGQAGEQRADQRATCQQLHQRRSQSGAKTKPPAGPRQPPGCHRCGTGRRVGSVEQHQVLMPVDAIEHRLAQHGVGRHRLGAGGARCEHQADRHQQHSGEEQQGVGQRRAG